MVPDNKIQKKMLRVRWGRVDNGPFKEGQNRVNSGLCVSVPGSGRPMSESSVVYIDDCVEAKVM